jgi:hypothetical protein
MTTQFPDAIPDTVTTLSPSAHRVTPEPSRPFSAVFRAGATAVIDGAEAAAHRLPGGPLVSAALRPGLDTPDSGSLGVSGSLGMPAASSADPGVGGDPMAAAIQSQAESSLYFLQLQQQIQEENRSYSTLSNVLKARHETVKNAIGNIR